MEASALTHAEGRGLFARPSPLLGLQGDDKLVASTREGNVAAFEALVSRYQPRLLGFCRQMLRSTEDAEDVLQEVFVAAYNAMLADERAINVRPWLYRIARNRCLNHLRKPVSDGVDTMDVLPFENGASTHDRAQTREEFRNLLADVGELPETQRTALLLREIDAMSYDEIAISMDTTVPGVKSLLVRARIALAESTQARELTCDDVKLELAEVAEGLTKITGPVRRHVRGCESCKAFRSQLRANNKALAALFPVPLLAMIKGTVLAKLGFGSGGAASSAGAGAGGSAAVAGGGGAAAAGGTAAGGGIGAVGAALGTKAAVGVVSAALLTAGAVEVKKATVDHSTPITPVTKTAPAKAKAPQTALPADAAPAPAEKVVPAVPVDPAPAPPAPPSSVDTSGIAGSNGASAEASSDSGNGSTQGFPPDSGGTVGTVGDPPAAGGAGQGDSGESSVEPPASG